MAQTTVNIHSARTGDVIIVLGHRVGDRERLSEILKTLGEAAHAHYRVRWDDGNESIFYPGTTRQSVARMRGHLGRPRDQSLSGVGRSVSRYFRGRAAAFSLEPRCNDDPPIGTIVLGSEVIYVGNGEWQPLDNRSND